MASPVMGPVLFYPHSSALRLRPMDPVTVGRTKAPDRWSHRPGSGRWWVTETWSLSVPLGSDHSNTQESLTVQFLQWGLQKLIKLSGVSNFISFSGIFYSVNDKAWTSPSSDCQVKQTLSSGEICHGTSICKKMDKRALVYTHFINLYYNIYL